MKQGISIVMIIGLLIIVTVSKAQKTNICVMGFVNEKFEEDSITKDITEYFEKRLSQYKEKYTIVSTPKELHERYLKNRKQFLTYNDIKSENKSQPEISAPEEAVYGHTVYKRRLKIYNLRITFINIKLEKTRVDNIFINRELYEQEPVKLQNIINKFVDRIIDDKQIKSPKKYKFGVIAGINPAYPPEKKLANSKTLKMATSYHVGVIVAPNGSNIFHVESGLRLSCKGAKLEEAYTSGTIWSRSTISPLYLEMPLNLLYSLDLGHAKMCLFGGGYVGIGISGKIKSESANDYGSIFGLYNESTAIRFGSTADSHLNQFDFGLNIGLGVEIIKNIFFRAQYNIDLSGMGLINLGEEKIKSSVEFSIGYMFGRI